MPDKKAENPYPLERPPEQGKQRPIAGTGADPDPAYDSNEPADAKAKVHEPDGAPSPRHD